MILVSGDTYPHRATLKDLGFRWKTVERVWTLDNADFTKDRWRTVRRLDGILVRNTENNKIIDRRTV